MRDAASHDYLLDQLRRVTADLNSYIERRAAEIAAPRIAAAQEHAAAAVAEAQYQRTHQQQRDADVMKEMRRQIETLHRNQQRYLAQLRASGATYVAPQNARDLPGDPPADDPATQILTWLEAIMPGWPADHELLAATTSFHAPFGARLATDFECHPTPSSRNIPLGALIRALQAVAHQDRDATAYDVLIAVRNVLVGHRVAEIAERLRESDQAQLEVEQRMRGG